jgi:hypothetical protein
MDSILGNRSFACNSLAARLGGGSQNKYRLHRTAVLGRSRWSAALSRRSFSEGWKGTGARGEQYLDGPARSRTIAALELLVTMANI